MSDALAAALEAAGANNRVLADQRDRACAALEARDRRIAELEALVDSGVEMTSHLTARIYELEAGLREIAPVLDAAADQAASLNEAGMSADLDAAYRIARDLLAGRAARGEG